MRSVTKEQEQEEKLQIRRESVSSVQASMAAYSGASQIIYAVLVRELHKSLTRTRREHRINLGCRYEKRDIVSFFSSMAAYSGASQLIFASGIPPVTPVRVADTKRQYFFTSMAYSGASQIIYARQCWHPGNKALPGGIVARTSNLEMRPLWNSVINNRISKLPLTFSAIAGVKQKRIVNKIAAEGAAEKPISNDAPQIKHDVFVSFRGEDIRHGFLGHLIKAFHQKQINAFVDDKLKRGDDISSSLIEAIEGSFISLIIFSENYASSRWCLKELVKIMECKKEYGQIVIPVFYEIDPTDVRHQKKSYEKAIAELEKKYDMPQVQIWKDALNKSANLAGIKSLDFRNEVELLEEMINLVLMRLSKDPVNQKGLVGIGKPMAHLQSSLQKESNKVRVIGIWGMGGIGKTTIAEEIFNQYCSEYEGCCFLATVSEELKKHGLASLKEKLFSTLITEDVKIKTPNGLSNNIERRIGRMKVLIVLDDVSDTDQLEKLLGTLDWFRSDSRIIVTTRDKQVLIANRVDDICEVGVLNSSEALELFNLNAFNQSHLEMEYYDISKRVVNYAKGIPLVLKVLGHLLRGKGKEVWESQLDKLKKMPSKKVHDVLRLSYDDLDRLEQKIFLDIACFFKGLNLKAKHIKVLLKDCDSDNSVAIGLESLKDKALITISDDDVLSMHDIIQEMGREVVRQESCEDPGCRSRLWDPADVCEVLNNDKGTEAIRSIRVGLSEIRKLKLSPHVFDKMNKLLFLSIYGRYDEDCCFNFDGEYAKGLSGILPQGLQSLPTDLRYLHWIHYPLKSLPEKYSAEKLVILELPYSRVERLWCGVQNLVNLNEVRMFCSKNLEELPDFSKATNLEVLNLNDCSALKSVHPSIFSLDKLEMLCLNSCYSLTRELWDIRFNALPSYQSKLEALDLGGTMFESIPSWIINQTRLRHLYLRFCSKLKIIPELPSSLKVLNLEGCKLLRTVLFPSMVVEQFKQNRRVVSFWNCMSLDERTLKNIVLNAQISMMKYTYQHISGAKDNNASDLGMYWYPGSSIPEWLEYKTTKDDMIIDILLTQLSPLLGFVFCFILSMGNVCFDRIELNVTTFDGESVSDGDGEPDNVNKYLLPIDMDKSVFSMDRDHVFVLYWPECSSYLNYIAKNQTRFKIKATTESDLDEAGPLMELKGFGVSTINHSTYHKFIKQMELFDYFNKWNQILLSFILCISFQRLRMRNLI